MPAKTTLQWWMPREAAPAPSRDPPGIINVRVAELRKPGRCGGGARTYQTLMEWLAASPDHIYCGRRVHHIEGTFDSPFRNDVPGVTHMDHDAAIFAFEQRFRQKLSQDPELIEKLVGLRNKTLGCWCKPKACHCDVLLKLADEYANIGKAELQEMKAMAGVAAAAEAAEAAEIDENGFWLYDGDVWDPEGWMDDYDDDGPLTNAGPMVRGNRGAAGLARGRGGGRKRVDGKGSVYSAKHARKVAGRH